MVNGKDWYVDGWSFCRLTNEFSLTFIDKDLYDISHVDVQLKSPIEIIDGIAAFTVYVDDVHVYQHPYDYPSECVDESSICPHLLSCVKSCISVYQTKEPELLNKLFKHFISKYYNILTYRDKFELINTQTVATINKAKKRTRRIDHEQEHHNHQHTDETCNSAPS